MITFSTCFYILQSKFSVDKYIQWASNFLSIVNNFYLVIYTDKNSIKYIPKIDNQNIKIIIKPVESFYNIKYKEYWISNHKHNHLLNKKTCWELNMLWSEKLWFVQDTINHKYFDTEFYGWCDIGYFRNGIRDINTSLLKQWPNKTIISGLNKDKIHYACINNDSSYINSIYKIINNKNHIGLPINPIPENQMSIAGGFFLIHKDKIEWWVNTFDNKLRLYFENNYIVKDDQIIIVDCIMSNLVHFQLYKENNSIYNNWFMFQRKLL